MNGEIATEQWDDILDEKVPGRKTLLMTVFSMAILLGAAVGFIAYKETNAQNQLAKITAILAIESLVLFVFHKFLPSSPIKVPLSYMAKFFLISAAFGFAGCVFK